MTDAQTPEKAPENNSLKGQGNGPGKGKGQGKGKKAAQPQRPVPQPYVPRPPAKAARAKPRHWFMFFAFIIMVAAPVSVAGWYLYTRAADQYASTLGFTVRSEDVSSAVDILGGLGSTLGGGGGGDSDILYEFIRSQEMVRAIDTKLDLRGLFSRHVEQDPVLGFDPAGTIEDLTTFWRRMVRVSYDTGSGLIELRVLAFEPEEAKAIAEAIYDESSVMINALSAIARADATRYAQEDLELSLERLKTAREALTAFRLANQIVDPNADIQTQIGLLATLQEQQATAIIEYQLISETASEGDPRVAQARRRLEVIEAQVEEERKKFGAGGVGPGGQEYAKIISEFERLTVDREFAETAYAATLSAFDAARAEANRQSRYLAAYIQPTLAERSEFPQREVLLALVTLFSFLTWAIISLIYYALRDRR
ncbi:sugar transporter [Yoonia sp. R2331]|uniref:sugar transporter n=1 Tax=Yoonia sp. R2331 TaxID=3237238 RepID=UPI0034E4D8A3